MSRPASRYHLWVFAAAVVLSLCWSAVGRADDEARLLRFPAIHADQIVFTYAGDLYSVPSQGGVARRLTSDPGFELFARFSPDGKWIAFTGQYDGNTEVYLMPAAGGVPKRLTYTATLERDDVSDRMGPNNIVMTWHDDKTIVFRSRSSSINDFLGQLYTVSIDGGMPEQLPLPRGGWCSYSPDGKQLAYNRVFREFRTWKRYRGGMADDIWLYNFADKTTTNLTNNPAVNVYPMWHGDQILLPLRPHREQADEPVRLDPKTKATRQLTHFDDYDIKFPSLGDAAIVFENGGYIYRFDLATQQAVKVPVYLHEDLATGRDEWKEVGKQVSSYDISPDGHRAVFGARGDVFTVPAKYGNTRNLTQTPGVHERNAVWSPDGKSIAYISDATGEEEIHVVPQDGSGPARQLTSGGDTYKYDLLWSPDSRRIAWSDKKQRLLYVDVQSKAVTLVAQSTAWEINDYQWSPDSQWMAFAKPEDRQMPKIYLFSAATKESWPVTDEWFVSSEPVFSADGKYTCCSSRTAIITPADSHSWEDEDDFPFGVAKHLLRHVGQGTRVAGRAEERRGRGDQGTRAAHEKKAEGAEKGKRAKAKAEAAKKVTVKVDLDGLPDRVGALPLPPGGYGHLSCVDGRLYYCRGHADGKPRLMVYDFEDEGDRAAQSDRLPHRGRRHENSDPLRRLVRHHRPPGRQGRSEGRAGRRQIGLEQHEGPDRSPGRVEADLRRMLAADARLPLCPEHAGRRLAAKAGALEPLLPYVNHRADLTYVIGELIGELNIGHAYVGGGDYPKPRRILTGLLGAQGRARSGLRLLPHHAHPQGRELGPRLRSPLTEIGVNVKQGDYILAIDGKPTNQMKNIYAALVDTVGKQVTLRVNAEPMTDGSHRRWSCPPATSGRCFT